MAWPWHDASVYQVFIDTVRGFAANFLVAQARGQECPRHTILSRLLLGGWGLLYIRPCYYARDIGGVRDLAALGVGNLDAGVIEQETEGAIEFNLGFFVGGFGGDQRDFGLSHGGLILQDQS